MAQHHLCIHMTRNRANQLLATGPTQDRVSSQPLLSEVFNSTSQRAQRITNAVLCFICKDLHPYSLVDNEGFRQLLNECEPGYAIPTRRFITDSEIPQMYADKNKKSQKQFFLQRCQYYVMPGCREQPSHMQLSHVSIFYQTGKLFHTSCRPVLCSTATLGEILQICYGTWWMNGGLLTKTLLR